MARRRPYQFTKKKHSGKGIFAFVAAAVLFAMFWILIALAFRSEGTLPAHFGSIGLLALLLTVVNLIFAMCCLGDEESFPLYPRLASIVSIVSLACWVGVYVLGVML